MNIEAQRDTLIGIRSEIAATLESTLASHAGQEDEETPTDSDVPTHEADSATVLFERERDSALEDEMAATLRQIDHALERIASGEYERCEVCGKPIGEERLLAQPQATLCIEDQENSEKL